MLNNNNFTIEKIININYNKYCKLTLLRVNIV